MSDDDGDDPFSDVDADPTTAARDARNGGDGAARDPRAVDAEEAAAEQPNGGQATDGDAAEDAPLGELAARVGERREQQASAADAELFTEQSATTVDRDHLWDQVAGPDAAEDAPGDGVDSSHDERVVSKRSYCQGCEHFSEPPDVRCTHEGTEILEAVDLDRFRVVDCPVVREDELLGKVGDGRDGR